jgi:hypothetical protein
MVAMLRTLALLVDANKKTCGQCKFLLRSTQNAYHSCCDLFKENLKTKNGYQQRLSICLHCEQTKKRTPPS